jgi:hypothetical protein
MRMSTSSRESHPRPIMRGSTTPTSEEAPSAQTLTNLRGSSVGNVDARRVGQVLLAACLVTLAVLVVVFSLAGAHRNNQVSKLHNHGVKVGMTVTRCAVLLGGSGSNDAGHACRGAFTLDGHHYTEAIPGSAPYTAGQSLRIVVVPGDPALLAPVQVVAHEHSSWTVFVLPVVLFVVLLLAVGLLVAQRRKGGSKEPASVT